MYIRAFLKPMIKIAGLCLLIAASSWAQSATGSSPAKSKQPIAAAAGESTTGTAVFYITRKNGKRTANGERFSSNAMTAAHKTYPLGTRLRVTNEANGRSVIVRVNDRGPFTAGHDISLTRRAASRLGFIKAGSAKVKMEVVGKAGHQA
jgi:rare lipoprotein A